MDVSDEHQYWFSPFGVRVGAGVLFAVVLSLVAITYAASYVIGERIARLVFVGGLGFLVLAPGLYSGIRSPFEERRKLVSSFAGGGFFSTPPDAWFPESVGFMRILIYEDGVEVRADFCCYFIPYDEMIRRGPKTGWLRARGLSIESELPGVPNAIDYYGLDAKQALAEVEKHRRRFLGHDEAQSD
jgi:hypothetical protein